MKDGTRAIGGIVVDESGRPIARAFVSAKVNEEDVEGGSDRTDAKGRFLIEGLKPGRYRIKVSHKYSSDLGTLETGTLDARLVVRRGATITGFVHDEKGNAIEATVRAHFDGQTRRVKAGADGAFEVAGLPTEGECDLQVLRFGYAVTVLKSVLIGRTGVVVTLRPGLQASGSLRDAAGTPLARTRIYFRRTEDALLSVSTRTDQGARFKIDGLNPGRYEVEAMTGGKYRKCGTIEAGATGVVLVVSE